MFAEAAREMLIQNQEQIGMDYNNVMDDGQHDQQMNDYPETDILLQRVLTKISF